MKSPTLIMSRVSMKPIAWARALGGVLIGNAIPKEDENATQRINIFIPPSGARLCVFVPSMATIGRSRLAVAVLDMNVAIDVASKAANRIT